MAPQEVGRTYLSTGMSKKPWIWLAWRSIVWARARAKSRDSQLSPPKHASDCSRSNRPLQLLLTPSVRARLRWQTLVPTRNFPPQAHNDMIHAGAAHEHVGDEFGRDRRAGLVLLVLSRVREMGPASRCATLALGSFAG